MKIKKAVFPVGGFGTRFLPATKASPKEMLPLVDKPLIHYGIMEAVDADIKQIILITGRGKRAIADYFDICFELEYYLRKQGKLSILKQMRKIPYMADYIYVRQREPKGLGHAIWRAKEVVGNEPFAVILADDIIDTKKSAIQQMLGVFEKFNCSVIGLQDVERKETSKYGIVSGKEIGKNIIKIDDLVEKPKPKDAPSNLAIVGRYILTPGIFSRLEELIEQSNKDKLEIQLTDALKLLTQREPVYGYKIEGKRYDCGDKMGFLQATINYALKDKKFAPEFLQYLKDLLKDK
ncbi:MAG: UTP--glucose-1-phosphate uridylyltransferase GalU [Deltaproteobacteria bacterium]|nr:UTP--glucose-1-phosphate uridylyltransferase GalU [Deltaproteobacteria bacterium]